MITTARGRFLAAMEELFAEAAQIIYNKNSDYAQGDDPFLNFKGCLEDGLPVERGMLVRMRDKMARISNLISQPPMVKDESIRDTCIDLANYAMILAAWLEWDDDQVS